MSSRFNLDDSDKTWVPWVILAVGVLAASVSAILIRYAQDASGMALSFWRSAAGSLLLLPFAIPVVAEKRSWWVRLLRAALVLAPLIASIVLASEHEKLVFEEEW